MAKTRPSRKAKPRPRPTKPAVLPAPTTGTMSSTTPPSPEAALSLATTLLTEATALLQTSQPLAALPLATRALALLDSHPSLSSVPPSSSSSNSTTTTISTSVPPPSSSSVPPHSSSSTLSTTTSTSSPIRDPPPSFAAHSLLAEISITLGSFPQALLHLHAALALAPTSTPTLLWLAQLSPEGGHDSIQYYTRATEILRADIAAQHDDPESDDAREKRKALATALCSMVEVWMTDLSWDEGVEAKCERAVGEAVMVVPEGMGGEVWQTVANVRISQGEIGEARGALRRGLAEWMPALSRRDDGKEGGEMDAEGGGVGDGRDGEEEEGEEEGEVPDFPTRVALVRLLLEVGMGEEALRVLDRLVREDDESVECWYLGGWGMFLMGEAKREGVHQQQQDTGAGGEMVAGTDDGEEEEEARALWGSSREWLRTALQLYEQVEYEDERLREHAVELVEKLDGVLGEGGDESDAEQEGDEGVVGEDAEMT